MDLMKDFTAAHAALHHTDGSVEMAQSVAFGAEPGQALNVDATTTHDVGMKPIV